jgi:hypothetical protein
MWRKTEIRCHDNVQKLGKSTSDDYIVHGTPFTYLKFLTAYMVFLSGTVCGTNTFFRIFTCLI